MKQKRVVKLTKLNDECVLIGTESMIDAERVMIKDSKGNYNESTKIESRGAMISTVLVKETPEEIYKLING